MRSALLNGVNLTMVQMRCILSSLGVLPPSVGSGKNQAVLKKDVAETLVRAVFKDLTDEERKRIVEGLTGPAKTDDESAPLDLIEAVSYLDPSDQVEFEEVVTHCVQKIQKKHDVAVAKLAARIKAEKSKAEESKAEESKAEDEAQTKEPKGKGKGAPQKDQPMASVSVALKPAREVDRKDEIKVGRPGKSRVPTPDVLKSMLPPISGLYLAWMPEKRMVQVQFEGKGNVKNVSDESCFFF